MADAAHKSCQRVMKGLSLHNRMIDGTNNCQINEKTYFPADDGRPRMGGAGA